MSCGEAWQWFTLCDSAGTISGRESIAIRECAMSLLFRPCLSECKRLNAMMLFFVIGFMGCTPQSSETGEKKASLKRPTTDKVGEFDPEANNQVVTPDVKMTNPITGPLEAYDPLVQQLATLNIDQAVALFQAEQGEYPKSHEEFMTRIIQPNHIRLPGLPAGLEYQYDVENHKLRIVRAAPPANENAK